MNNLMSQVSYPVFLYLTFVFLFGASVFSFLVGVALAFRSQHAFRFFDYMNRWVSLRKMMRPMTAPHYVEPALFRRRILFGLFIMAGGAATLYLLSDTDLRVTLALFEGLLGPAELAGVAANVKGFLMVGNAICILIGAMVLFAPGGLRRIENVTDHWYSWRRSTRPLELMHMEVDHWVIQHATSAGITLSALSLTSGMLMLGQLQNLGL